MSPHPLVGVDWGTSNLRVFRFDAMGTVLETRATNSGIAGITDGMFEATLAPLIDDWMTPGTALWLCGMIGSRQGWHEATYAPCPANATDVASHTLAIDTRWGPARIVPGATRQGLDGLHDVMRGEETQVFGCGKDLTGAVVTPGTHSKWVRVEQGRILDFQTYMTGEVFALMRDRSILGRLFDGTEHDAPCYERGVQRGLDDRSLLSLMFSTRTEGLFSGVPAHGLSAYLSGLLIGSEIAAGWARAGSPATVAIIANAILTERYVTALTLAGATDIRRVDGDSAVAAGLWRLFTTHTLRTST